MWAGPHIVTPIHHQIGPISRTFILAIQNRRCRLLYNFSSDYMAESKDNSVAGKAPEDNMTDL